MRITLFPMVTMILATLLHILLSILFVIHLDYGVIGLAMAVTCRDFFNCVLTALYGLLTPNVADVMLPFDMEALRGWGEYL